MRDLAFAAVGGVGHQGDWAQISNAQRLGETLQSGPQASSQALRAAHSSYLRGLSGGRGMGKKSNLCLMDLRHLLVCAQFCLRPKLGAAGVSVAHRKWCLALRRLQNRPTSRVVDLKRVKARRVALPAGGNPSSVICTLTRAEVSRVVSNCQLVSSPTCRQGGQRVQLNAPTVANRRWPMECARPS